jgi:hypothetical protein
MFKFLKEALADVPSPNPQSRIATPGTTSARRISSSIPASTKPEPHPVKKVEDDATEEDLVVRTLVETLRQQNGERFEAERVGEVSWIEAANVCCSCCNGI